MKVSIPVAIVIMVLVMFPIQVAIKMIVKGEPDWDGSAAMSLVMGIVIPVVYSKMNRSKSESVSHESSEDK